MGSKSLSLGCHTASTGWPLGLSQTEGHAAGLAGHLRRISRLRYGFPFLGRPSHVDPFARSFHDDCSADVEADATLIGDKTGVGVVVAWLGSPDFDIRVRGYLVTHALTRPSRMSLCFAHSLHSSPTSGQRTGLDGCPSWSTWKKNGGRLGLATLLPLDLSPKISVQAVQTVQRVLLAIRLERAYRLIHAGLGVSY